MVIPKRNVSTTPATTSMMVSIVVLLLAAVSPSVALATGATTFVPSKSGASSTRLGLGSIVASTCASSRRVSIARDRSPAFVSLTSTDLSPQCSIRSRVANSRRIPGIFSTTALSVSEKDETNNDGDDPLPSDQREGMTDAFAGLESLTADDFDDLKPISSSSVSYTTGGGIAAATPEEANVYVEMQAELGGKGDSGLYADMLDDLGGSSVDLGTSEDKTGKLEKGVLENADGLGASAVPPLTTADVVDGISLGMEDFMSQAVFEAINEVKSDKETDASAIDRALEEKDLKREIEIIFDVAGEKLKKEVEAMRMEQEAVTQASAKQGILYVQSENDRLAEAEASVSRLIQKVSDGTDEVEKAMVDLEQVRADIMTKEGGGMGGAASDLKQGGLVQQAALVGGLLFGSRAVTEGILVFGGGIGAEGHVVTALVQLAIALACGAYLVFIK